MPVMSEFFHVTRRVFEKTRLVPGSQRSLDLKDPWISKVTFRHAHQWPAC